jgi:cob(I)alamin adenosyltransferase
MKEPPLPRVPPHVKGPAAYASRVVRIYTGTGDDGSTGLLYGGRISKADAAAEAYGSVDETVAAMGLARALAEEEAVRSSILRLQRELFVVGADLATNPRERSKLKPEVSLVTPGMVERLERLIDEEVERNPLPQEFIVPGANPTSAALDVARTLARRAERRAVELREAGREVNPDALRYLNRLSDLLFVVGRSQAGGSEEPSRPA